MTSIQAHQDRHSAGHPTGHVPAGCDQCGQCADPATACARRVPVLLMSRGAVESLRAVEMKAMALSPDDVRCMVDTGSVDDTDEVMGDEAGDLTRQLSLSF